MNSASTVLFYTGLQFDHLFILLVFFFIASTLIWGTADPRPHPLTVATRWLGRRARVALTRAVAAHRRHRQLRRHPLPAAREPGASWPVGGAP